MWATLFGGGTAIRRSKGKAVCSLPACLLVSLVSSSTLWLLQRPPLTSELRLLSFPHRHMARALQECSRCLVPDWDCQDIRLTAEQLRGSQPSSVRQPLLVYSDSILPGNLIKSPLRQIRSLSPVPLEDSDYHNAVDHLAILFLCYFFVYNLKVKMWCCRQQP